MARFPGAHWDPLPENNQQTEIVPTQVILHTAVDAPGPTRLEVYFARVDVKLESHFWIPLQRETVQMMDTEVRADANYRANKRPDGTGAISIETEDEGDPVGVPWTQYQIDKIIAICIWAHVVHGIPLVKCPGPDEPGLGYHAMWGAPSGWTPSRGKTCPGETRIRQFEEIILPALKQTQEIEMTEEEARAWAMNLYLAINHRPADAGGLEFWAERFTGLTREKALIQFIGSAAQEAGDLRSRVRHLEAEVAALKEMPIVEAPVVDIDIDIDVVADSVADILADRLSS